MKLFHLSDLHIGKRVNEFSMIEDQKYILSQILHAARIEKPDGILLAGDIYDSTIPSAEAVQVFDAFLTELSAEQIPAFIISGNHDSAERLAFGSSLMGKSGIYFPRVYDGTIEKIPLQDVYGTVWIHLLPFLRPAVVRHALPERAEEVSYAADAVRIALEQDAVDGNERNVLLAHQFVTGAKRCEAEELQVGDLVRSRWNSLKSLIMWHWDTSTVRRKWEGRRCVTADRRSNTLSRKPVRKNPSRWSN